MSAVFVIVKQAGAVKFGKCLKLQWLRRLIPTEISQSQRLWSVKWSSGGNIITVCRHSSVCNKSSEWSQYVAAMLGGRYLVLNCSNVVSNLGPKVTVKESFEICAQKHRLPRIYGVNTHSVTLDRNWINLILHISFLIAKPKMSKFFGLKLAQWWLLDRSWPRTYWAGVWQGYY